MNTLLGFVVLYLVVAIALLVSVPRGQPWQETKDYLGASLIWPVFLGCLGVAMWQDHREKKARAKCPCEDCAQCTNYSVRRFLVILMIAGIVLLLTMPAQ